VKKREKVYCGIIHHKKIIIVVFVLLAFFCMFFKQLVSVNYDMNDYLPVDSTSTLALNVMEEEFEGSIPNARVMVSNVAISEALEIKKELMAVDGVKDVTWLDDVADVTTPLETMEQDTLETYYIDGSALFSVAIDEEKRIDAVTDIREIIGDENSMTGSAVSTAVATISTVKEVSTIAVIAVLFVLLVLLVTTTSFVEPFIVLAGLGISIIINAGSNLIFGEISFVTNAAGNVLQMAVALDYSVFLIHRFAECRKTETDVEKAMVNAIGMSMSSIMSSGLTTVIGFLALCLMQFQIGPDLGLALAKGITISLITVFVFMPALIISTYKWMDKTEHRPFLPSSLKLGKFVRYAMIPMVLIFAILLIPSYLGSNANSYYYGASHIFDSNTQIGSDTEAIEEKFGQNDTYVLMIPKDSTATEYSLSKKLKELPQVKNILSYVDTVGEVIPEEYLDEGTLTKLNSENYTRMVITVEAAYEGDATFSLIKSIREIAQDYYPDEWYLAGEGVSTYDLMNAVTADMVKVNLVAIGAVFLILAITMHSIIVPVILVLSIETAIWINLSIPYFMDQKIFFIAYLIISSIQLGATVDYAILFTERYKEYRTSVDRKKAIIQTISAVTVSIMTSASVLALVGFLLGIFSTHGILSQLGFFLGKGTLCSLVIVMFVLPGLLYLFDGLIMRKKKREVYQLEIQEVDQNEAV